MTEEEALLRVHEIGQAFANDLNDGDTEVNYEGLSVTLPSECTYGVLEYEATMADGTVHTWTWALWGGDHRETP